jgi:hypothetical protein
MLCFVLGTVVLAGCSGKPVGSNITSIYSTGFVCFACSGIEHAKKPFGQTRIMSGIIIRDGSLVQSAADLTNSLRRSFVLINNRFLGGLVAGEYWQLQSTSNILAGSPMMDTRPSKITFLQIDPQNVITNVQELKVAYVTIAVDPADFGRPFTGYVGSQ